ncbi:uncharacterized protein [Argopecten irradians]|uniref:uncharacterized protein n=1 Tax=Argopecten irradians TaxID=31199 RepID=UPI0037216904
MSHNEKLTKRTQQIPIRTTQNSKLAELQVKYDSKIANLYNLQLKYDAQEATLTELQTKYDAQSKTVADFQIKIQSSKGAVIKRWGRSDCPANITTKVYSGTTGGSDYTHTGAAAEYVCMPDVPIWGPHKDLVYGTGVGYICGAEYEGPIALFGMPNSAEDVPCAVCLGTQYTASLMIPDSIVDWLGKGHTCGTCGTGHTCGTCGTGHTCGTCGTDWSQSHRTTELRSTTVFWDRFRVEVRAFRLRPVQSFPMYICHISTIGIIDNLLAFADLHSG